MICTLKTVSVLGIRWECGLLGRFSIPEVNVWGFVITLY